jgi:hypothetical protein
MRRDRLGVAKLFEHEKSSIQPRRSSREFYRTIWPACHWILERIRSVAFRATLRPLFQPGGMEIYLYSCKVLVKEFANFAKALTNRIRKAAYASFEQAQRPIRYLTDSSLSKEDLIRRLAQKDGIQRGPIALLACVEPCLSFHLRGDRKAKELRLVLEHSKCTHLYHYLQHAQLGQLHVRLQSWFPFSVDVCLNGRQWLARQMDQAGIAYVQRDKCFVWIEDAQKAQRFTGPKKEIAKDKSSGANCAAEWPIFIVEPKSPMRPTGATSWR